MSKQKPAAPKPKKPAPPSAKVGNYRAPVDTVGLDPEMKRTMGFGRGAVAPKKRKGR